MRIVFALFILIATSNKAFANRDAACEKPVETAYVLSAIDNCVEHSRNQNTYRACVAGFQYAALLHVSKKACRKMRIETMNYCYDVTPNYKTKNACYDGASMYIDYITGITSLDHTHDHESEDEAAGS